MGDEVGLIREDSKGAECSKAFKDINAENILMLIKTFSGKLST